MLEDKESLQIANQTIYFESSEKMHHLSDGSIDIIITSPPYNRNKNYSSDDDEVHNDNLPEPEYLEFLKRVWKECLRVASDKAVFFLNIGDSATDQGISEKVVQSAVEAGWIRIQDLVWVKSIYGKGHYTPTGSNKRFNNVWEHIFLLVKNPKEYELDPKAVGVPYADKSNIGRYNDSDLRDPGNVFHICYEKTTGATIKKGHDAPFPIGLPYICIKAIPKAKTVLDPFLGTGTTLAAALNLGLQGFGYEKYPRKELIKQTIKEGPQYYPSPIILIPHYEESINVLMNFLLEAKYNWREPRSKKEMSEWEILTDTLTKLGVKNEILEKLQKTINEAKITKKTTKLDQFLNKE